MDIFSSVSVNSVGLLLDIVGALLLWRYGLPEAIDRLGRDYIATRNVDEAAIAKSKVYDRFGKIGIALLVVGFSLQLLSNFIPS